MKYKYVILLTACVNPGNMVNTVLVDAEIRRKQYIDALKFYLAETDYPIVFIENTEENFSDLFKDYITSKRLEYITFQGNNNLYQKRGKGYGEAVIIEYALRYSQFIHECEYVVKITGRLKLINMKWILWLHKYIIPKCDIQCGMDVKARFSDSRLMISNITFLKYFIAKKEMINDDFECVLFECLDEQAGFVCYPVFIRPSWIGTSGTGGDNYWTGEYLSLKLNFLQNMLEYCIVYNRKHKNNSSFFMNCCLKFLNYWISIILETFKWWKNE